ncbi:interferon alpha/beta receptor 1a [Oncorhynchus tshawytscha]|uniref:Fibronectin type-III domain-containing protein n=1 Tax=Oncorhynchus tshawytscha TaxID=74940 RepID=A0A8C8KBA6_ONCTS|nr:interferon alpha/beta receptor 1a [Oncorhynchus tshawytscha]XP_024244817.1 interferon alpha/beta receptor 1a [Oncorhynchus tshawytscha]
MNVGFALVLLWSLPVTNVLAELPVPQNLTLLTLNTEYLLTWDWDRDQMTTGNTVTFTAEYMGKYKMQRKKKNWSRVCERTIHTHCNFTGSDLHYLGMYVLRVRASADGLNSDWVLKDFCPDKDAALGPPSRVELAPVGNLLDVTISDPLTSTQGSMKEHVLSLYYHILYWSLSDDPRGLKPNVVNSNNNLVTLPELEAWTWYCVMVQSRYDYYNKTSGYTAPQCMQTEGDTQWRQIFLYFLVSLVVCFLLVLLPYTFFRFYRVLKHTFYPTIQLPAYIQEYLCDSSLGSEMPILLTPESELCCDNLSVYAEVVLLEIHIAPPFTAPSSGLQHDSSRHSRQGSEGSGDSGVYSTEGGSGQQGSSGGGEPIRRDKEVEKVKLEEMGEEPGDEGVPDEGVVDVCI